MKSLLAILLVLAFHLPLLPGTPPPSGSPGTAGEKDTTGLFKAGERLKSYEKHLEMAGTSPFANLQWRGIGPYFTGGRIDDIEGCVNNPYKFYAAAASGGLWLTENNGTTWTPIFENESSITIGDIAISQTDDNLIWVGTGEQNSSRSSYAGTGIFKSTDGGKSWKNMGLTESHHIGKVIIHPKNNNIVWVAVLGHLYTDNEERGLYKTTDGGLTWKKTLYIDGKTGVIDAVLNRQNPDILYAASWQRERKAWNFSGSGVGSAVYKSTDGGDTWKKSMTGLPSDEFVGRIGLAVAPSNPDVVYVYLDNKRRRTSEGKKKKGTDANANLINTQIIGAEVYRTDNGGDLWKKANTSYLDGLVYTYGYYFGRICVAPDNENTVYLLGVPLLKSTDGGKTFGNISQRKGKNDAVHDLHGDMQALWIDPENPARLLLGNDGGINVSYDAGASWKNIHNIPLAQCYTVHYDWDTPYNVYTGLQDNGVSLAPADFSYKTSRYDSSKGWELILWGDGAFVQPEPPLDMTKNPAAKKTEPKTRGKHKRQRPKTVYAAYQFGYISRIHLETETYDSIRPKSPDMQFPYRFNWLSPFMISHHNPFTLYMGANKMLKSVDRGNTWTEISPDLTDNKNTTGNVPFATIVAIDESPLAPGLLYAGTDDGNVRVKKANSCSWEDAGNGLPKKWVTRLVASKYKKGRVYITLTGYRDDDFKSYVYRSEDFGKHWSSLSKGLPNEPINVLREDPVYENLLYLGSDLGIYVTLDGGNSWLSLKNNLPTNAVYDLRVHPRENELIIGTHGRGVFILPVEKIQWLAGQKNNPPLHLFPIGPISLSSYGQSKAELWFYAADDGPLQITIKKKGNETVVGKVDLKCVKGFNFYSWNPVRIEKKDGGKNEKVEKGDYILSARKGKEKAKVAFKVM
ncbi:MAG: glycosyl hydrolase [bacterium]|nr:glycosyl hydrolase [bacterium]